MDIEISEIRTINIDTIHFLQSTYKTVTIRLDDVKIFLDLEQAGYIREQLGILDRIPKK